jgi:hypothetical protein
MKKFNGKYTLIRRSSAPKADNTIGMYKRDGKGAYTTDEDHDCAEIHPDASHKQWTKKNIKTEEDDVQMTANQKASDDAEKRRAADAKKREAIQNARQDLQKSNQEKRKKLQQAKTTEVDESSVKDIVGQALRRRARRKEGERKSKAYQDSVKAKAKERDTAGSLRATLKGTPYGRRPLRNGDDEYDVTDESVVSAAGKAVQAAKAGSKHSAHAAYRAGRAAYHRERGDDLIKKGQSHWDKSREKSKRKATMQSTPLKPQMADEEIEENQDNKEAKRKAEHSALVARLIAARGTKPKKGPYKPHPKTTVHKIKYGAPHDPKYGPGGRYDTLTGKREEVEWDKMTQKEKEAHAEKDRKKHGGVPYPASAQVKPEGRPRVKGKTPGRSVRENLAYSKPDKAGRTFVVSKRKKPGDKVSMSVRDSQGNVVKDHGSHVNAKGAKKFATSRGYDMEEGRNTAYYAMKGAQDWHDSKHGAGSYKSKPWGQQQAIDTDHKKQLQKKEAEKRRRQQTREEVENVDEGRPWGREIGAEWDEPDGPDYSSRPSKDDPKRVWLKAQRKRISDSKKKKEKRDKKNTTTEEVSWDEAQYWSEDTVAAFLKRGGKITQLKPRVARGATKKKTIRLKGVKSTDRGRKAEKKMHGEEVVDEGGIGSIYPKDKPLQSPTAIKVAKALSKKRAAIRNRKKTASRYEEYLEGLEEIWRTPRDKYVKGAGGRGLAAKTEREEEKAQQAKARAISAKQRKQERDKKNEDIEEAVSVDGRTRDYRGTRTRLESKGRRRGAGLDGRTKGYRDARTRITARQQRAATDAAMMEPEATTEIEEMQSGSKQSKVEKTGTHSSNLSYLSRSPHAVGRSAKKEKKRASKEARQARKQKTNTESVSITPEQQAEIRKKVRADIEKDRQAKKARDKKAGRYMDHWGNWRTKGKPNPADELTRDFNKESVDKEELKRLIHNRDLDNRHRRREDKAAQRTAKTKRSFGPKGKKPAGTMKIAFNKALEKKQQQEHR